MKLYMKVAIALLASAILLGIAWAATTFTFVQTLNVPPLKDIQTYKSDGTTQLADGSDLSTLWSWDSVNKQFTLALVIKNVGTTTVTTSIGSSDTPGGWTLTSTGTGSLAPTASQPVTVQLANPSAVSGGVPTFHITVQGA